MKTEEINKYLIKYDSFIQREVKKRVKPREQQVFQVDDIIQETRIFLFKLIQERFDPSIADIDTFIVTHTPYSVYKAITYISRTLYYTGKYDEGEGRKAPRPGSKQVDDHTLRVDFIDFEPSRYPTDSSKSLSFPVHDIIISGTYIPFDALDKTYYEGVRSAVYSEADPERELTESMDVEIIKREVRKRLTEEQKEIFDLLVMEGENSQFLVRGRPVKEKQTRYLTASEAAEKLGYAGSWTIHTQVNAIKEITLQVLEELGVE